MDQPAGLRAEKGLRQHAVADQQTLTSQTSLVLEKVFWRCPLHLSGIPAALHLHMLSGTLTGRLASGFAELRQMEALKIWCEAWVTVGSLPVRGLSADVLPCAGGPYSVHQLVHHWLGSREPFPPSGYPVGWLAIICFNK